MTCKAKHFTEYTTESTVCQLFFEKNLIFLLWRGKGQEPRENKERNAKKQNGTGGIRDGLARARVAEQAEEQIADGGRGRQKERGKSRDEVGARQRTTNVMTNFVQEKEGAGKEREEKNSSKGAVDVDGHIKVCRGQHEQKRGDNSDAKPRA